MNKRQRKKLDKNQKQQIEAISNIFDRLKIAIENMLVQLKNDPVAFRKLVMESDLPNKSKAYGIALSYIVEKNQECVGK